MELVSEPAGRVHDETGEDVGRGDQALRSAGVETQAVVEDLREEVGESVRYCGRAAEDHGVGPDLPCC